MTLRFPIYQNIIPSNITLTKRDVVVVDDFKTKVVDVDGDGIADISHGRAVTEQLVDNAPDHNIIGINGFNTNKQDDLLHTIASLNRRKDKPAGVNFSLGDMFGFKMSAFDELLKQLPGNLLNEKISHFLREDWLTMSKRYETEVDSSAYRIFVEIIAPLAAGIGKLTDNTTVTVSSGNKGHGKVNLLGFDPNIHVVGATDAKDQKAYYSNDNKLTNEWAQGTISSTELFNEIGDLLGYDITGNGKVNITVDEVSGGQAFIKQFTDQPISQYVEKDENTWDKFIAHYCRVLPDGKALFTMASLSRQFPDYWDSSKFKKNYIEKFCNDFKETSSKLKLDSSFTKTHKLYPLADPGIRLLTSRLIGLLNTSTYENIKDMDTHLNENEYIGIDTNSHRLYFFKEKDGKIIYDPDNSGRPNAVACLYGTSFAAPNKLAEKLNAKSFEAVA